MAAPLLPVAYWPASRTPSSVSAKDSSGRPLSTDEATDLCVAALRLALWELRG